MNSSVKRQDLFVYDMPAKERHDLCKLLDQNDTWAVLAGVYYTPVDQLTIGLEGEWYTSETSISRKGIAGEAEEGLKDTLEVNTDNWSVDLVSVWRF